MSTNKAEKAVAYASLILADDSIQITPEKLQTLLKAAGIEDVEPIWTTLVANALRDKDVKDIITAVATAEVDRGLESVETGGGKDRDDGSDHIDVCEGSDEDGDFELSLFD